MTDKQIKNLILTGEGYHIEKVGTEINRIRRSVQKSRF